jgi:hypothetical protein
MISRVSSSESSMISVRRGIPIKYLLLSISFLVSLKSVTREAYLVTEKKGSRVQGVEGSRN